MNYIHRDIENLLLTAVKQFSAVAITGPRQSGKSTLLKKVLGESYNYITFDDPLTRERAINDPKFFLEQAGENVILDEIQYVPELLSYIKIIIDNDRSKFGQYIITGSQQFHLIKNLGDSLAGRIVIFNLLGFNTNEKLLIPKFKKNINTTKDQFVYAALKGSFPELVLRDNINNHLWYSAYLQTYLERDVRTMGNIGDLRSFQQLIRVLASRCSQILNYTSISKQISISVNTVKKWISILEASHIIFLLQPYYSNLGKRITKSPKLYFLDIGIVCYLTGIYSEEHLFNGPMAGALFENFIVQETVKSLYNQGQKLNIFYVHTNNQLEVDLLLEKGNQITPFEIKLSKTPNIKMAKQIERFRNLFSELVINEGYILSLAEENIKLTNQVSVLKFRDYLVKLNE